MFKYFVFLVIIYSTDADNLNSQAAVAQMSTDPSGYAQPIPQGAYGAQLAQAMSYGGLGAGQVQQPMVGAGYIAGGMPDPYASAALLGGQAQFMPQAAYPDVITAMPQYAEYGVPQYGMQSQRMYDAPTRRYGYMPPVIGPPIIGPPMVGPPMYSPYASPYGLPYY